MKKLIFRKFLLDVIIFFTISALSLTLIVWVIQAVNYLDFVSEDGHNFRVYFLFTLLSVPKIFSKLIIFLFFIAVISVRLSLISMSLWDKNFLFSNSVVGNSKL